MLSADKVCLSGGWYLDSLKTTPGHFDGWDYYLQEPTDFEGTAAQKKLVMGGKVRAAPDTIACLAVVPAFLLGPVSRARGSWLSILHS